MLRSLISILILFAVQCGQARILVWPLGFGARFERDQNQSLTNRGTQRFAVGLQLESVSVELATDRFSTQSSEGNVSIKRKYQDFTLWLGHEVQKWDSLSAFASAGLGQYQETLDSQVSNLSDESTSSARVLTGLGLELRYRPFLNAILISTGARILWAESFDPSFQPDVFARLGFEF